MAGKHFHIIVLIFAALLLSACSYSDGAASDLLSEKMINHSSTTEINNEKTEIFLRYKDTEDGYYGHLVGVKITIFGITVYDGTRFEKMEPEVPERVMNSSNTQQSAPVIIPSRSVGSGSVFSPAPNETGRAESETPISDANHAPTPDDQAISHDGNTENDFRIIYKPIIDGWKSSYESVLNGGNPFDEDYSFWFYNGANDTIEAYYALYDIDSNGIPELILKRVCSYEEIIAYIFSFENGVAVNVFGYDGDGRPREVPWSRAGSSVVLSNGIIDSTVGDYTIYKISDDGCNVTKIASSEPYDYSDMAGLAEANWRFYVNGAQVDYDMYVQYLKTQGYNISGNNALAIIDWDIISRN